MESAAQEQQGVQIDLSVVLNMVCQQRNAALDTAAKFEAATMALSAQLAQAQAELVTLRTAAKAEKSAES